MGNDRSVSTSAPKNLQGGFSFMEVLIAMSILVVGSVSVLGLFTIGVNRMVQRRVDARLMKVRPEIDSILQTKVNESHPDKGPENTPRTNPIPLSRRGYALAITWTEDPFETPHYWAQVELLYDGKPVRLLSMPVTRSYLTPSGFEPK